MSRWILALALLLTAPLRADERLLDFLPAERRTEVENQLASAGPNRAELIAAIEGVKPAHRRAVAFLVANMPRRDLQSLKSKFLIDNVTLAYEARDRAPWGKDIPDEVFLDDVLPYSNLNERRDDWRGDFLERFGPLVKNCESAGEAAMILNGKLFPAVNVKYHPTKRPKADQSPYESIEAGYASCSGLSILLADACRAVGVPARVVGTPAWTIPKGDANGNHGGNHSWVEVWDGRWRILGASEVSKLDEVWFLGNASRADPDELVNRIYAASFRKTGVWFPLVWAPTVRDVWAEDVTRSYLNRTAVTLKVDRPGRVVVRLGGRLIADAPVADELAVVLSAGQTYDATVTAEGKTIACRFVPKEKGQVIRLGAGG